MPIKKNKFIYADSNMLQKYLSKVSALSESDKKNLSRDLAYAIDGVINDKENPGNLAILLQQLADHYSNETISLCLLAVRDYINSDNFVYSGKYKTRSWLWGEVKYIALNNEDQILKNFNATLDTLIKEYKEMSPSSSNLSENKTESYSLSISTSLGSFVKKSFILFLALPVNHASGQEFFTDQHENDAFFPNDLSAHFIDLLPQKYHVITNAKPSDVRIRIFLENHTNLTHHQLKNMFVPALGKPGDLLLFEGTESMAQISCDEVCIGKFEGEQKRYSADDQPEYRIATLGSSECIEKLNFDKFVCLGSDNMEIVRTTKSSLSKNMVTPAKLGLMDEFFTIVSNELEILRNIKQNDALIIAKSLKRLYKICEKVNKISNIIITAEQLTKLSSVIKNYNDSQNLFYSFLTAIGLPINRNEVTKFINKDIQEIFKKIKHYYPVYNAEVIIVQRNKEGIIKTLENPRVKNHKGQVFLFWGAGHLVPDTNQFEKLSPNDYQYELRQYLNQHPHWIGFPK